jgi:hypothetical protein
VNKEQIIQFGKSISIGPSIHEFVAKRAEVTTFIASTAGKANSFYQAAEQIKITATFASEQLTQVLASFLKFLENDLISNASYDRKIQIAVVNDYLSQAEDLLDKVEFHPATAAFLIGASLEEFLRTWTFDQGFLSEDVRPTIDGYANVLKSKALIDKQDHKEITAWGGLRNHAAHGHWDFVSDRDRIKLMLSGVTLFIKKYSY